MRGLLGPEREARRRIAAALRRYRQSVERAAGPDYRNIGYALSTFDRDLDAALRQFAAALVPFLERASRRAAYVTGAESLPRLDASKAVSQARTKCQQTKRAVRDALMADTKTQRRAGIRRAFDGLFRSWARAARQYVYRQLRNVITAEVERQKDKYRGWVWVSQCDRRTCPVCWAMHGTEHQATTHMVSHLMCRCWPKPVRRGAKYGGGVERGVDLFRALPGEDQRAILGPGKYALYKSGKLDLMDLVGRRSAGQGYGPSLYERPLKRIV